MFTEDLRRGAKGEQVRLCQKAMNELVGTRLKPDGAFGPSMEAGVRKFQQEKDIAVTGIIDEATYELMADHIASRFVSYKEIDQLAIDIGIRPSALRAVFEVESKGDGFNMNGSMVILFEGHWFYRLILQKLGRAALNQIARDYPSLCYEEWTRKHYIGGEREWTRLNKAISIDEECALKSASYGLFQVMGFNFKLAGYDDVYEYFDESNASELMQLEAGVSFILNEKRKPPTKTGLPQTTLMESLKRGNWASFAYVYNGSGYKANAYDRKLADAARRHAAADR